MDFNFVTLRDTLLMISHWLTDNIVLFKLEAMISADFPVTKIVVSSANKTVCEGGIWMQEDH